MCVLCVCVVPARLIACKLIEQKESGAFSRTTCNDFLRRQSIVEVIFLGAANRNSLESFQRRVGKDRSTKLRTQEVVRS